MKYAIGAALALVLGIGIVGAAQAQDTPGQNTAAQPNMQATAPAKVKQIRTNRHAMQPKMVRQTQQRMQAQGFYNGPINGKWTPQTKRAFAKFQKQNKQFARTAKLNHNRVAHSGSSMPRHANAAAKKPINQQQAMPKQTQAPSTGSSTPPASQNTQQRS